MGNAFDKAFESRDPNYLLVEGLITCGNNDAIPNLIKFRPRNVMTLFSGLLACYLQNIDWGES